MNKSKTTFWSRIKKAIESDYLGKPLDTDKGLIETISEEVLSKFVSNVERIREISTTKAYPKNELHTKKELFEEIQTDKTEPEELKYTKKVLLEEIQAAVRIELDKGKSTRRIINIIVWIVTLIAGGFVGVLFQNYVEL